MLTAIENAAPGFDEPQAPPVVVLAAADTKTKKTLLTSKEDNQ